MSRHLSVASVIEKNRIASEYAYVPLLEIEVVNKATNTLIETLRFARNPEDVVFRGQTYIASAFDFDVAHAANQLPEVTLNMKDPAQIVLGRMEQHQGGVGFKIWLLVVNAGALDQPPEMRESFYVMSARAANYDVEWRLGARNPLQMRFPRRHQRRDRCSWTFRGEQCAYSGPDTTCDYTLTGPNGCSLKGNALRYGGIPGLRRFNV